MDPQLSEGWRRAGQIIAVAQQLGYDLPDDYIAAHKIRSSVTHAKAAALTPEPPPPTDPKSLTKYLTTVARLRVERRELDQVAAEVETRTTRAAAQAALASAAGYARTIADDFDSSLGELLHLITTAPREITSASTTQEFNAHQALLKAVENANRLLAARTALAVHIEEDREVPPIWLVLDPPAQARLFAVRTVLERFGAGPSVYRFTTTKHQLSQERALTNVPSTVGDWAALLDVGVSMAAPAQAAARRTAWSEAVHAGGMTADGGTQDKTIEAALGAADAWDNLTTRERRGRRVYSANAGSYSSHTFETDGGEAA